MSELVDMDWGYEPVGEDKAVRKAVRASQEPTTPMLLLNAVSYYAHRLSVWIVKGLIKGNKWVGRGLERLLAWQEAV